jgi:hypothetical protein
MKKLLITSSIVTLAMIGFIVVLCILPCNGNCWGRNNNECSMTDSNGTCSMDMDSSCADGKCRKEIRITMNDRGGNCQNGNAACPKDKNSCNMNMGGNKMMMGGGCCCCCCMMMMRGGCGDMMMHNGSDSMKVMVKVDTLKKMIKTK